MTAVVHEVLRVRFPEDAPEAMLGATYGRPCEDCGARFETRDLHLHVRRRGDKTQRPRVLCPRCASRRGTPREVEMKGRRATAGPAPRPGPGGRVPPGLARLVSDPEYARMSQRIMTDARELAMKHVKEQS